MITSRKTVLKSALTLKIVVLLNIAKSKVPTLQDINITKVFRVLIRNLRMFTSIKKVKRLRILELEKFL